MWRWGRVPYIHVLGDHGLAEGKVAVPRGCGKHTLHKGQLVPIMMMVCVRGDGEGRRYGISGVCREAQVQGRRGKATDEDKKGKPAGNRANLALQQGVALKLENVVWIPKPEGSSTAKSGTHIAMQ